MPKTILKTDYKDDVMTHNMDGKRRYRFIQNDDNTFSMEDVTEYEQIGSNFGAAQINTISQAVNESVDKYDVIKDLDEILKNLKDGKVSGALALKALAEKAEYEIERGGDENGTYIKYNTGRMIQRINITKTGIPFQDNYSPANYPDSLFIGRYEWKFPVPFRTIDEIGCNMFKYSTGGSWGTVSAYTTTYAVLVGYDTYRRNGNENTKIHAYAIGTW